LGARGRGGGRGGRRRAGLPGGSTARTGRAGLGRRGAHVPSRRRSAPSSPYPGANPDQSPAASAGSPLHHCVDGSVSAPSTSVGVVSVGVVSVGVVSVGVVSVGVVSSGVASVGVASSG